jgi:endoglucanase
MAAGGTDTGEIHLVHSGVPAITIGLASRYIHTNSTIMDFSDYLIVKEFTIAVLRDLNAKRVDEIKSYNR